MRLALVAVGRLKTGPERDLVERYRTRIDAMARPLGFGPLDCYEIAEGREPRTAARRDSEGQAILKRLGGVAPIVFDERGRLETSLDFAERLRSWRDAGRSAAPFVIGGPDGLDDSVRHRAAAVLAFGPLTLPHGLVRVLVAEQIYRALTIVAGHPYHREGDGA